MDLRGCFSFFGVDWPGGKAENRSAALEIRVAARQSAPHPTQERESGIKIKR
jgi:hypothetical protein